MNRRSLDSHFCSRSLLRLGLVLLAILCGASNASAESRVVDVLVESRQEDYWVCVVTQGQGADAGVVESSVRQRTDVTGGVWTDIAKLQTRVTDLAGLDGRLAILTIDGDIRLVTTGGGTPGPRLPNGYVAKRLASSANGALYALAVSTGTATRPTTQVTTPATIQNSEVTIDLASNALRLFVSKDGLTPWRAVTALPADTGVLPSLGVYGDVPWIAYTSADRVIVRTYKDAAWITVAEMPARSTFKLLSGAKPVLGLRSSAGGYSVYDVSVVPPALLHTIPATQPADIAFVGPTLRSVAAEGEPPVLVQRGIDANGQSFGPDQIARALPVGPNTHDQWMQFALLALMTVAMVLSFRARPALPKEVLERAGVRVAPLSRRIAAGVIDASPYIAVNAYLYPKINGGKLDVNAVPSDIFIPLLIAMSVYLLHTTIGEIIYGKSIGKMLFGLRVVSVDGSRASVGRIILRNLMRILDVHLLLPLLFVFLSPMRQRIGDLAASTIVVDAEKKPPTNAGNT